MKSLKVKFVFFVLTSIIIVNCDTDSASDEISRDWRSDNNGCKEIRLKIVQEQYAVLEKKIIGQNINYIIEKLGKPNEVWQGPKSTVYVYWVSKGAQCLDGLDEDTDALRILIDVKGEKVMDIRKFIS